MINEEPVIRDKYGFYFHSIIGNLPENAPITTLPEADGMIFEYVALENDVSEEVLDKYLESNNPDISFWQPTSPGNGFFLIAIYDTEDGAMACFAKPQPLPPELTEREIFNSFISTVCQCGKPKKSRMSHCRACYHALPPEAKKALYQRFGQGYEEAYRKSLEILNER